LEQLHLYLSAVIFGIEVGHFNNLEEEIPSVEEIITNEDGSMVKRNGGVLEEVSPEEVEARKKEISEKVAGTPVTTLKAVEGAEGKGQSYQNFTDGTYYQKVEVESMTPLQKGYFYEAWLEKEEGNYLSIGRMNMTGGRGEVYYSAKADRTEYSSIVITRETEDGNPSMSVERVLVGTVSE
jgi:hypothetical protein